MELAQTEPQFLNSISFELKRDSGSGVYTRHKSANKTLHRVELLMFRIPSCVPQWCR